MSLRVGTPVATTMAKCKDRTAKGKDRKNAENQRAYRLRKKDESRKLHNAHQRMVRENTDLQRQVEVLTAEKKALEMEIKAVKTATSKPMLLDVYRADANKLWELLPSPQKKLYTEQNCKGMNRDRLKEILVDCTFEPSSQ